MQTDLINANQRFLFLSPPLHQSKKTVGSWNLFFLTYILFEDTHCPQVQNLCSVLHRSPGTMAEYTLESKLVICLTYSFSRIQPPSCGHGAVI